MSDELPVCRLVTKRNKRQTEVRRTLKTLPDSATIQLFLQTLTS